MDSASGEGSAVDDADAVDVCGSVSDDADFDSDVAVAESCYSGSD